MEKICNKIDQAILAELPSSGIKAYGFCELVTKSKTQHPVTYDTTRQPAEIRDSFDAIIYHRLLNSDVAEDEDMSFGLELSDIVSLRFRTFVASKVHMGENFILKVMNAIPKKIDLEGFKFIHRASSVSINADHEAVYVQEYGDNSYEKHRTPWNIYALEYNFEFIEC